MAVNHIKRVSLLIDPTQHAHVRGQRILAVRVKPQRAGTRGDETGAGLGVPTGEEGNLVP
jgi:hypothetical protein